MIDFGLGVQLKALNAKDLDQTYLWRNNPAIWKWCRQNSALSWAKHISYFEGLVNDKSSKMFGIWYGEKLIGVCGFTSIDHVNQHAEFSLYIGPEFQHAGYGKSALKTLCKHGFDDLNLNHIFGETFEGNPAAKMFEKVGFKLSGTRRGYYYRGGRFIDCYLYDLLRSEFQVGTVEPGEKKFFVSELITGEDLKLLTNTTHQTLGP